MFLKTHTLNLWNGGLDPASASPSALRERRTISGSMVLLMLVGILVMVINLLRGLPEDNATIAAGLVFIFPTFYIQAKFQSPQLAANLAVVGFWAILVLVMRTSGILGQTWIWLYTVPVIATLLAGLTSGLFWSFICAATIWIYTNLHLSQKLTLDAQVQALDNDYVVGLASEGSLVLVVLCVSVYLGVFVPMF